MAPNVAFCRPLIKGQTRGQDVIAHKRALSRAAPDLYPWQGTKFTPVFGERFETAVQKWQRQMMKAGKLDGPATGRIGKPTHELLERTRAKRKPDEFAFDKLSIVYAAEFCDKFNKTPEERAIEAGFYWYSKRAGIVYSQFRPMQLGKPPWIPDRWDCSGFVTNCYYAGGMPDPNGRGYDGLGYTGTLMSQGRRINRSELGLADLIFYGYTRVYRPGFPIGSPTHVAIYTGDNMVLSMGSYPMRYVGLDYRSDINHFRKY